MHLILYLQIYLGMVISAIFEKPDSDRYLREEADESLIQTQYELELTISGDECVPGIL